MQPDMDESLQGKELIELAHESFEISSNSTETLTWNDESDPENPYNWPVYKNWSLTCLAAFTTFLTMMTGTFMTVAHFKTPDAFNIDKTAFPHS